LFPKRAQTDRKRKPLKGRKTGTKGKLFLQRLSDFSEELRKKNLRKRKIRGISRENNPRQFEEPKEHR